MRKVWASGPVFHVEWLFGNGINYILSGKPDFPCFALQINVCITEEKRKKKNAININRHDPRCLSAHMSKNHPPPKTKKKGICISIDKYSKWIPLLYVCVVNTPLTLSYCEYRPSYNPSFSYCIATAYSSPYNLWNDWITLPDSGRMVR